MRYDCPKCKEELRWESNIPYIKTVGKQRIFQWLDIYFCLHCKAVYTKVLPNEYVIKGEIK